MKTKVLSIIATGVLLTGVSMPSAFAGQDRESGYAELMMKSMDTNSDGNISKDEFMKMSSKMAAKKFMMMDMNDDGNLSKEEFMSGQR